jgi:hypothetical protein
VVIHLESMILVHYRRIELKRIPVGFSLLSESVQLVVDFVSQRNERSHQEGSTHSRNHYFSVR